jgi:uncharacterized LabA/DUF88 family protein
MARQRIELVEPLENGRGRRKTSSSALKKKLLSQEKQIRTLEAKIKSLKDVSKIQESQESSLTVLHKEISGVRRDRRRDHKVQNHKLDQVLDEFRALKALVEATVPSRGRVQRKGLPARVGVFIDVQNMYYSARQLKGKLDFDALMSTAIGDRRQILAQAFVVESKEIDQSGFIAHLEQRGIKVSRKTVTVRADGSMKGDWDMEMALAILDAAPMLDVVVLVSGDGDFTSLVNRVKAMGPRVEVIAFPRNTAKALIEAADLFSALSRKFMIRNETTGRPAKRKSTRQKEASPISSEKLTRQEPLR